MKGIAAQVAGLLLIVVPVGGWWLLDLYGCAFNTAGCGRILPHPTSDALVLLLPVAAGVALILWGRRLRRAARRG